jgi:thiol-disulfide isomerase/thioredoxin
MERNVGLALVLAFVMTVMGGIIVYDFIKNNRAAQITGHNQKDWKSTDNWAPSDRPNPPPIENVQPIPSPEPSRPLGQLTTNSYDEATKMSAQYGMPILVVFHADWCSWCKRMEQNTLSDQRVQEIMTNYIYVRVDTNRDRSTANKFGVRQLPSYIITNSRDASLKSGSGYKDANSFARWLDNPSLYQQPRS